MLIRKLRQISAKWYSSQKVCQLIALMRRFNMLPMRYKSFHSSQRSSGESAITASISTKYRIRYAEINSSTCISDVVSTVHLRLDVLKTCPSITEHVEFCRSRSNGAPNNFVDAGAPPPGLGSKRTPSPQWVWASYSVQKFGYGCTGALLGIESSMTQYKKKMFLPHGE